MADAASTRMEAPLANESADELAYELRSAEGATWTAGKLLVGIGAFFYVGLGFAYFYLRSANSYDLWRPHSVTAPVGTGTAIMAFTAAATGLLLFGLRQLRRNDVLAFDVAGWVAVLSGLLALGLQCWELTDLPFAPATGGYTSVFIGWAVMNIMMLVSGIYWAETLLARRARLRKAITEEGGAVRGVPSGIFRLNVDSCVYFWGFIAFVAVFFWIFFYIAG